MNVNKVYGPHLCEGVCVKGESTDTSTAQVSPIAIARQGPVRDMWGPDSQPEGGRCVEGFASFYQDRRV